MNKQGLDNLSRGIKEMHEEIDRSWAGELKIDHILPESSFEKSREGIMAANHPMNLRLVPKEYYQKKGDKIDNYGKQILDPYQILLLVGCSVIVGHYRSCGLACFK